MNEILKLREEYREYIKDYFNMVEKTFKEKLISCVIFGSIIRGKENSRSDIDVLLIIKGLGETLDERMKEFDKIFSLLKEKSSYKVLRKSGKPCLITEFPFTPEEIRNNPPILLDLLTDRIILFDKNSFLKNILSKLNKKLIELDAKKVMVAEDRWYWILKPDIRFGEIVRI